MAEASVEGVSVLIVEDQELVRVGLKVVISGADGLNVRALAQDGREAVERAKELSPDVVVMDIGLPIIDGIEATRMIKEANSKIRVVMLTSHDDDRHIFAALAAGADGYCLKETPGEQLITAIRVVADGAAWLDPGIAMRVLKASARGAAKEDDSIGPVGDLAALSPREMEVLRLVVDGHTNQAIADKLIVSVETVKTHMRHIMEKLRVSDRTQAAVKAMREGLF